MICERLRELSVVGKIVRVLIRIEKNRAPLILKDRILEELKRSYFSAGIGFKFVENEDNDTSMMTDDSQPSICVDEYLDRLTLTGPKKDRVRELSMAIMQEADLTIDTANT